MLVAWVRSGLPVLVVGFELQEPFELPVLLLLPEQALEYCLARYLTAELPAGVNRGDWLAAGC